MKDNLATRVRESYKLDDKRFREIVNALYDKIREVEKTFEALECSKPAIVLDLGGGEILIRAEYHVGDKGRTVLFDYVGRLVAGSRVDKSKTAPLYLQIFNPPNNHLGAIPNPNLVDVLKEYIS